MTREEFAAICKAMSDANRLRIIEMLTQGEKWGCSLLEELKVTRLPADSFNAIQYLLI